MENEKSGRFGYACAILLAMSYVIVGLTYLFLPADQKGGTMLHDPEKFLASMNQAPALITIHHLAFGLGALVGLAVVLAVFDLARDYHKAAVRWASGLGLLGFAVTAIDNFKIVANEPVRAARYISGDPVMKSIMKATDYLVSVDPQMWLGYGLVGFWALAGSWILWRNKAVPRVFGILGIAVGLSYFFVEIGTVIRSEIWLTVAAAAGAVIVGPVWYVWLAMILRKWGRARCRPGAE